MKVGVHKYYFLYYIFACFLEALITKQTYHRERLINYTTQEIKGFKYIFILSKLLLKVDISNYSSFYFSKNINTIFQIKVVKALSLIIWSFLGFRHGFTKEIVFYLLLKCMSFYLLTSLFNTYSHYAYHNYNLRISTDVNLITAHILNEIITAFKSAMMVCAALVVFNEWASLETSSFIFMYYAKGLIIFSDRLIGQRLKDKALYYKISPVLIGCTALIQGIVLVSLVHEEGILQQPVYIFNEIILVMIFVLQCYYLYLVKNVQRN